MRSESSRVLADVVAIASGGSVNLALVSPRKPTLGITASGSTAGQLTLRLSGESNQVYAIETSADLLTWQFLRQVTNDAGAISFEVGNTNVTGQFFRARRP